MAINVLQVGRSLRTAAQGQWQPGLTSHDPNPPLPLELPAGPGVAFDAATPSGDLSTLTSGSWSHTCSGSDRALVVVLAGFDATNNLSGVTVTYNGVAMTKLGGNQDTNNNNTVIWGLANPASGSNTVQVSNIPAGFDQCGGGSISFTGVHQRKPFDNLSNGANLNSVSVRGVNTGDMVVDCFYDGDNDDASPEAAATKRISQLMVATSRAIASTRSGKDVVTPTYSTVLDPMITGVRLLAAYGAPSTPFSGALSAQAATMAGTVSVITSVTGALAAQAATLTGAVSVVVSATGSLVSQAATLAGTAQTSATEFTGALAAQAATLAGTVSIQVGVSGALAAQSATVAGVVSVRNLVTGAMAAQAAIMSGAASVRITPSGALVAQSATMAGAFTAAAPPSGVFEFRGALSARQGTMSGDVSVLLHLLGSLTSQPAKVDFTIKKQTPKADVRHHRTNGGRFFEVFMGKRK